MTATPVSAPQLPEHLWHERPTSQPVAHTDLRAMLVLCFQIHTQGLAGYIPPPHPPQNKGLINNNWN